MISIRGRKDPRMGRVLLLSTLLHLTLLGVAERLSRFIPPLPHHPPYEVEIVSLPVAEPLHSDTPPAADISPTESSHQQETFPPTPSPPRSSHPSSKAPMVSSPPSQQDSDAELERRIEALRRKEEERHLEESLGRLRRKSAPPPPTGSPAGSGTEQGGDYTIYLHEILSKAFRETITYQSVAPETAVRIIIDGKGRLIGTRIDRRSGDRLFDDAVLRAIGKVARTLRPPPDGRVYEHGFVFRPEGVGQ